MSGYDVVMLVLDNVTYDGRVQNEAAALTSAGYRVLVVGTQRAEGKFADREALHGFDIWRVRYPRLGAGLWRPWRWIRHVLQAGQIIHALRPISARAYHAHDFPALLLVSLVRILSGRHSALIYDAHELYFFQTRYHSRLVQRWHTLTRPLFMALERYLIRRADGVLALGEGRARLLARFYGIPRPVVILNAVDPVDERAPAPLDLRAIAGDGRRCIVHTGDIADHRRALSELVRAIAQLPDDVVLVLLGRGVSEHALQSLAARLGIADRVHIIPPVPPDQVAAAIRTADIAAIMMRPNSWNTRAALPNKLFEAVAAGVPVLASDLFVLRRVVRRYGLGLLCDSTDPAAIAVALREMLDPERLASFREHIRAAQGEFSRQSQMDRFLEFYRRVLP